MLMMRVKSRSFYHKDDISCVFYTKKVPIGNLMRLMDFLPMSAKETVVVQH
jgi:hypothetical protein